MKRTFKPIHTTGTTKRGIQFNCRPTKLANGVSATFADQKAGTLKGVKDDLLKLCVWGTFDKLATINNRMRTLKVRLKHPTDIGYSKVAYILRKNKDKFADRIIL